nr:hypothetical protein Iba_chr09eCG11400 [Ipomoea batatas]
MVLEICSGDNATPEPVTVVLGVGRSKRWSRHFYDPLALIPPPGRSRKSNEASRKIPAAKGELPEEIIVAKLGDTQSPLSYSMLSKSGDLSMVNICSDPKLARSICGVFPSLPMQLCYDWRDQSCARCLERRMVCAECSRAIYESVYAQPLVLIPLGLVFLLKCDARVELEVFREILGRAQVYKAETKVREPGKTVRPAAQAHCRVNCEAGENCHLYSLDREQLLRFNERIGPHQLPHIQHPEEQNFSSCTHPQSQIATIPYIDLDIQFVHHIPVEILTGANQLAQKHKKSLTNPVDSDGKALAQMAPLGAVVFNLLLLVGGRDASAGGGAGTSSDDGERWCLLAITPLHALLWLGFGILVAELPMNIR